MNSISILGVNISNTTFTEAVETVRQWLTGSGKHYIVTPNPEFVMRARSDREFREILNKADLAIPDGTGLIWAGKILGKPFKEKITGVDLMLGLCKMAAEKGFTVGLLGAGEGVAKKAAEEIIRRFPNIKIVFCGHEWNRRDTMHGVSTDQIDLLFVAFGAPKQEKWMASHLQDVPVKVAMGVGGAFDYLAGISPRAPIWMRNWGLEWFFRLIHEPWRFRRQLAIWQFGLLIWREKFFANLT